MKKQLLLVLLTFSGITVCMQPSADRRPTLGERPLIELLVAGTLANLRDQEIRNPKPKRPNAGKQQNPKRAKTNTQEPQS